MVLLRRRRQYSLPQRHSVFHTGQRQHVYTAGSLAPPAVKDSFNTILEQSQNNPGNAGMNTKKHVLLHAKHSRVRAVRQARFAKARQKIIPTPRKGSGRLSCRSRQQFSNVSCKTDAPEKVQSRRTRKNARKSPAHGPLSTPPICQGTGPSA